MSKRLFPLFSNIFIFVFFSSFAQGYQIPLQDPETYFKKKRQVSPNKIENLSAAQQSYIPTTSSISQPPSGEILEQTLTLSPSGNNFNPNDPVQQALSLHQAGRYADAVQIYESIILNNPPDPRVYASISDAHFKLGNTSRALKYAIEALKLDPNYSSGHLLLGTILAAKGDIIRAVRSFKRVTRLDQHNPYAYYNLGLLYYQKADIQSAIRHFERARDFNPKDQKIWNNLGVAYYDNARYDEARSSFERAIALDPSYLTARENLENLDRSVSPFHRTVKKLSELFPKKEIISSQMHRLQKSK